MAKKWIIFFGAELAIAALAALMSYFYWGYAFRPPGMPKIAKDATAIHAMAALSGDSSSGKLLKNDGWKTNFMLVPILGGEENRRTLNFWREKHLIQEDLPELDQETSKDIVKAAVAKFPRALLRSSYPVTGTGFVIVSFEHPRMGSLYYVVVTTGQIANEDHHFFMEGIFEQRGKQWMMIEESSYYFDIAGLEDIQFESIFVVLNILFLIVGLAIGLWIGFVYLCMRCHAYLQLHPIIMTRFAIRRFVIAIAIVAFAGILWFWGFDGGRCGETPVRKIRFAVYEWDGFGEADQVDYEQILFSLNLVGVNWGGFGALRKIGGFREYIALKETKCSFDGKPPNFR